MFSLALFGHTFQHFNVSLSILESCENYTVLFALGTFLSSHKDQKANYNRFEHYFSHLYSSLSTLESCGK